MGIMTISENRAKSMPGPLDEFWYTDPGSIASMAGIKLSPEGALKNAAFWNGCNLIAGTLSTFPLRVLRHIDGGGKEPATDLTLYRLLKFKPNDYQVPSTWKRQLQLHLLIHGNAIFQKVETRGGDYAGFPVLNPARTKLFIPFDGSEMLYKYTRSDGSVRTFKRSEVVHMLGLSNDGLIGYSPVLTVGGAIGIGLAAEMYAALFFEQGSRPVGALTTDTMMKPDKKKEIAESWLAAYGGNQNFHKVAILDNGLEFQSLGIDQDKAQMLETRIFQIAEVARILNIPPHMLKDLSGRASGYNSTLQQFIEFGVVTMTPHTVHWEETLASELLTPSQWGAFSIKFSMEGLLRGDPESRSKFYNAMFGMAAYSPNDILELEDRNPIGEQGDQRFIDARYLPISQPGESQEAVPQEGRSEVRSWEDRANNSAKVRRRYQQQYQRVLTQAAEGVIAEEVKGVRSIYTSALGSRQSGSLELDLEEFYRDFRGVVVSRFTPHLTAYAELIHDAAAAELGNEDEMGEDMRRMVRDYADALAMRQTETSLRELRRIIRESDGEDDLRDSLDAKMDEWSEEDPGQVGQRESVKAGGALYIAAIAAMGVRKKVSRTAGDSCPICRRLDGRVVEISQPFVRKGETIDPDAEGTEPITFQRTLGHPPWHSGCDCLVVAGR